MPRLPTRIFTASAAAAVLLAGSGVSAPAFAGIQVHAASGSTFTTWRLIYRTQASLGPAAATGPRQVWVLASTSRANYLLRWNGSAWQKMAPLPGGFGPKVFTPLRVEASGPGNIWVFGHVSTPFTHEEAIVWNGRSWRAMTPQMPATVGGNPVGDGDAVVVSPSDVWYADGANLLHWDGTAWAATPFAAATDYPAHDLAATPGGTVWRVNSVRINGEYRPVARTWNGARWETVQLPRPAIRPYTISVSIWSGHDVWMGMTLAGTNRRIVLHWNGSRWRMIKVPSYAVGPDVTAAGPDRVWVSGTALWDGSAWILGKNGGNGLGMTAIPGTRAVLAPVDQTIPRTVGEIWLNGKSA